MTDRDEVSRRHRSRSRPPVCAIALLVASLLCFGAGLVAFSAVQDATADTTAFALAGEGLTPDEARAAEAANERASNPTPVLAWQRADGENGRFTRVVTARIDADGFLVTADTVRASLGVEATPVRLRLLALTAHGLLLAYPLLLSCWLLTFCRREATRPRTSLGLRILLWTLPACCLLAATVSFTSTLPAFGEFYPARWSDFPAWERAADVATRSLGALLAHPGPLDAPLRDRWLQVAVPACVAMVLAAGGFWLLGRWRDRTRPQHARGRLATDTRRGRPWRFSS